MKNMNLNVGSFATAKLQAKMRSILAIIALVSVIGLTMTACNKSGGGSSGGGKTLNSTDALKEYLDSQPANSADKPIKVTMNANGPMLNGIASAISLSGKYVSLNLSGNVLSTIPDFAFVIDKNAKKGCETLVSITIPNSVTSIGDGAFAISGLTSITIPNSVTSIGNGAFGQCVITSITIPNSVTSIGDAAFFECKNLTSITIPNSVTSIGEDAFGECKSLTSVTFQGTISPSGLNSYAFGSIARASFFDNGHNYSIGDLRAKYLAGGIGTYTRSGSGTWDLPYTWTKQPS